MEICSTGLIQIVAVSGEQTFWGDSSNCTKRVLDKVLLVSCVCSCTCVLCAEAEGHFSGTFCLLFESCSIGWTLAE